MEKCNYKKVENSEKPKEKGFASSPNAIVIMNMKNDLKPTNRQSGRFANDRLRLSS